MKRLMVVGAALAASLALPLAGSAAAPEATVCPQDTQAFSGAATTLVVPAGGACDIVGATIAQDLILEDGAGALIFHTTVGRDVVGGVDAGAGVFESSIGRDLSLQGSDGGADLGGAKIGRDYRLSDGAGTHMEQTVIGRDFLASQPQTVQTGKNGPDTPGGPVTIGHDFVLAGSPDGPFVFDGICNLHVGHDMRVTERTVTLGFGIRPSGCRANNEPANTIDHDLVVTGNTAAVGFFGPSTLRIADNHVGHDLVFADNSAAPGGALEVTNNTVGHDALCSSNAPAVTVIEPNAAGHLNTCG